MRILITGSNGLLGQKIVDLCLEKKIEFLATSKGVNRNSKVETKNYLELDISDVKQVEDVCNFFQPDSIINTAAITNVDFCETNHDLCDLVNVKAVKVLLNQCEKSNIHFVHLSTDFVFDGENGPYRENDKRNALSYYGQSKIDSEDLLMQSSFKKWSILRTIIVFGVGENMSRSNIVLWAKDALEKGTQLNIVDDQFRAPTFAEDLAWACIRTIEVSKFGVFHISGPETFSIIELVNRVGAYFNLETNHLSPIKSDTLNQAAKRPPRTGFDLTKSKTELAFNPLKFEESLEILARQLEEN
jgi:dTDP-4-dehydrorhamnose reductase